MDCVADIIRLWPSDRDFASDLGIGLGKLRVWRHRGFIPPENWAAIEQAAEKRGIDGASASDLAGLAAKRAASKRQQCTRAAA